MIYGGILYNNYYLYTYKSYLTISHFLFDSSHKYAQMFCVDSVGRLTMNVNANIGIRPVINLRSDVQFIGDGTQNSPFKVI